MLNQSTFLFTFTFLYRKRNEHRAVDLSYQEKRTASNPKVAPMRPPSSLLPRVQQGRGTDCT